MGKTLRYNDPHLEQKRDLITRRIIRRERMIDRMVTERQNLIDMTEWKMK